MLDGSVSMGLGDSLLLSGIGMLIVFMELSLLAVLILMVSKLIRGLTEKKAGEGALATAPAVAAPIPAAPLSAVPAAPAAAVAAGALTLTDVDAPTAATAMAVVSHQTGIPLNHLAFRSIKGVVALSGVEDREAAAIMALTAHKLGKPLNRLVFKSIKKV